MKPHCLCALLLSFLLAAPVSAEFYKYVDQSGNIRFTDDITMVPPAQRKKLKVYEEAETSAPAEAEAPAADEAEQAPAKEPASGGTVTEEKVGAMKARLDGKRAELAEEYRQLTEERRALEGRGKKFETKEEARQYEAAVRRLNEKNSAYEQKRKQFEKSVDSYNEANRQLTENADKAGEKP